VVTGGEPLLQREIGALTRGLRAAGLHVTVETSGTLAPDFECDLLSVSPKTSNSDPLGRWLERHRGLRSHREPLRKLLHQFPEHQLKFVIQDRDDLREVLTILEEMAPVASDRVLLMAEGRTAQEVADRAVGVAALCEEHGFRYTPRLHLDLFGGGRGV
jgi:7-carboxy-7-deazaguanine synthase